MQFSNISWRAVLISAAIAAGVYIAIRFVFSPIFNPQIKFWIFVVAVPLGTLAGGYYVGRTHAYQPILHSLVASLLAVLVLFVLRQLPTLSLVLLTLSILAGPFGAWWAIQSPISARGTPFMPRGGYPSQRRPPRRGWRNPLGPFFSRMRANRLYDELERRTRFDPGAADRLIDFERRRTPYASRETLIRNALERITRDNR